MEPLLSGSLANREKWQLLSEGKLDEKLVSDSLAHKLRDFDKKKMVGHTFLLHYLVFHPLHVMHMHQFARHLKVFLIGFCGMYGDLFRRSVISPGLKPLYDGCLTNRAHWEKTLVWEKGLNRQGSQGS